MQEENVTRTDKESTTHVTQTTNSSKMKNDKLKLFLYLNNKKLRNSVN